jgi:hypothetical protein
MTHLVCLLTEDGNPAVTVTLQAFWGIAKSVIMERCRRKHKLRVWINVFRVEEDFGIRTGIYK